MSFFRFFRRHNRHHHFKRRRFHRRHRQQNLQVDNTKKMASSRLGYVCAVRDFGHPNFSVRRGDILIVLENISDQYILAKNILTRESGPLHRGAVTNVVGKSPVFDAWRDVDRDEAVNLLSRSEVEPGTFILRPAADGEGIGLSVRPDTQFNVVHYKIQLDASKQYYLSASNPFEQLTDLISYYIANPDLLRCTKFKPYFSPPATNDSVVQIKGLKIFTTRIIGTGGFADVYHGSWHAQEAVVKCFKHLTCTETLYRWLQILKTLDSPYCVRVFDVFCSAMPIKGTSIVLAMEMMDLGSMKHFLTTPEAKAMPFEGLMGKIQKIASGMDYLEEKGVVHTNLKDTNVLLQSDGSVKLVDIGIRSALSTVYESSPGAFAFDCWSAPELESHPTNFTIKSDVWAFGILSYVILTRGAEPYQGWEMSAIPQHLAIGGRPEKPPSLSVEMYNMLKRCWEYKAEDRPSFREILSWTYASEENYEHGSAS